ncbi:MAG: histidine kinase [Frankiales bacterium]|nr:histidine kinase [Frankiales bacterium]
MHEVAARAVRERDRTQRLLEAVGTISGELDLQVVLRRIAEAAAELVDARYAALGVVGDEGTLSQFVTVGIAPAEAARIGPLPHGLGLLGELIRHPVPLRLADLKEHPSSYGFPDDHPPMTSFLGVPVRVRDRVYGNLYVTDKRSGEFDDADETLLLGLAAAVGITVANARLYGQARRRERAAEATSGITTTLLSGAEPETVLERAALQAADLVSADLGVIALPHAGGLLVEASWGVRPEDPTGGLTLGGPVGTVLRRGRPAVIEPTGLAHLWPAVELGAAVAVPLGPGVCVAARRAPGPPFSAEEVVDLSSFAREVTVALELAERRRDAERLSVYADRDRIARDLHDLVIQRLFATGMQLEGVVRQIAEPGPQGRVRAAVDDLDLTIREIRSTIYALNHSPHQEVTSLRVRLLEVIDAAEETLGFAPAVRMSGLLDTSVPPEIADHVVLVLREGLSNVARHAHARCVDVEVSAFDSVTVRLLDDGVGLAGRARGNGLDNLRQRAALAGGSLAVTGRPGAPSWSGPRRCPSPADPGPLTQAR